MPVSARPRHAKPWRLPSRLPALVRTGTVALVTSGVAVLGLTAPADAATDRTWNRLAQCESSGRWNINTGNGYYGGLQFSASTWRHFGGTAYASRADRATRAQQVHIAERTLKGQGWNAWPACSRKLGLTAAMKAGTPESVRSLLGRSSRSATRTTARSTASSGRTYTVRRGDTLGRIAASHRVPGGWRALYAANRNVLSSPHVLRVGQRLRLAGSSSSPRPAARSGSASSGRTYTVRRGDTLSGIASAQRVSGGWQAIYAANRGSMSSPHVLRVGQRLRLP